MQVVISSRFTVILNRHYVGSTDSIGIDMKEKLLAGKNAVITGATGGIARSIVEEFAKNGSNIWACHRKFDEDFDDFCLELSKKYDVEIKTVLFDISRESDILSAVKEIKADKKKIDVLVNNAGAISENASFHMQSVNSIKKLFDVNFFGIIALTQYVTRLMPKNQTSSIINISSVAGLDGTPGQFDYVASKSALVGATKRLSLELAPTIRVNCIAPGIIETDMIHTMDEKLKTDTIYYSALKRIGKPEEVAKVAVFLASEMSSYITGQTIRVDGGII